MEYFVKGHDGNEYGPVDIETLRAWAGENRLSPSSQVRNQATGETLEAGMVPGIWSGPAVQTPQSAPIPPPTTGTFSVPVTSSPAYEPYGSGAPLGRQDPILPFVYVLLWCALALLLFFVFHGIGIIIAAFTIFDAVRIMRTGSRYGIPALAVAILTTAVIGVGWLTRAQG